MAGNKFDTKFKKVKPKTYKVTYIELYNEKQRDKGTEKQEINHIQTLA